MDGRATLTARASVLLALLRAEIGFGILGLRLFMACVVIASAMLGLIWLLSAGLAGGDGRQCQAHSRRRRGRNGGERPLDDGTAASLERIGRTSRVVELRSTAAAATADAEAARRMTVELKAVDRAYPWSGRSSFPAAGICRPPSTARTACLARWSSPDCSPASASRSATACALATSPFGSATR